MKQIILFLLLLAGCASPSYDFMGATHHDVETGGIRFAVFHQGDEAQIIRMGYLTRAQRGPVPALMIRAAEMATGCAVVPDSLTTRIPGDTGVANVALDCPS